MEKAYIAATVNGATIGLAEVWKRTRMQGGWAELEAVIEGRLIAEEADRLGVVLTREELQRGVNEFRKQQRLYSAADTAAWLEERGLTLADLAEAIQPQLLLRRLADAWPAAQVESDFHERRVEFDRAHLSRIVVDDAGVARELRFRLEEGAAFHQLAREFTREEATRFGGGYLGIKRRDELEPAVAAAVFGARDGDVVGPIETRRGIQIVKVEQLLPAAFDAETEAAIREQLMRERLAELKRQASIQLDCLGPAGTGYDDDNH